MPGIKKKWIKASHSDQMNKDVPDDNEDIGDEDRELGEPDTDKNGVEAPKAKKRPAGSYERTGMLKNLDGEVLLEKRKRFIPPAEVRLAEWLDSNLEKRTEESLNLFKLYSYYTELCQGEAGDVVDYTIFNRMIKDKFGKSFGLQETSVYKSLIKERKLNAEKKSKPGVSWKDLAFEAINFHGNPWHGVRFFSLKQYIGTKYPALQVDVRPKKLKWALENQVQYGKIELVKGVGMSGFYKIPGGEEPPPKPKKVKKDEEKTEGEAEKTEGAEGEEKLDGDGKDANKKEESAENGEKKEEEDDVKKNSPPKPKKYQAVSYSSISHGDPQKLEDTFPLAITYQSAPKAVGVARIRKYIAEKYREEVSDSRWRQAIEKGVDKGYWEHVSGSGISGRLHLLMDDFDPSSDQLEDHICAGIIACHEPKSASALQIKKYINSYHPEFKVDTHPNKYKKALIRAVGKSMIVQLTGLGASGTYQLTAPFIPSPAILAGEDDSEESSDDSEYEKPSYVPRGTKSRKIPKKVIEYATSPSRQKAASRIPKGKGRKSKVEYAESSEDEAPKKKSRGSSKGSSKKGRGRPKKEDVEDEEEEAASRGRGRPKKAPASAGRGRPKQTASKKAKPKGRKRSPSPLTDEDSDDVIPKSRGRKDVNYDEDDEPEYTPVKSKSRSRAINEPEKSSTKKGTKDKKVISVLKLNIKTLEKVSSPKATPKKSKGKAESKKSTPARKASQMKAEDSDADDESDEAEPEYTPKKSKSRGGEPSTGSAKVGKKRKGR